MTWIRRLWPPPQDRALTLLRYELLRERPRWKRVDRLLTRLDGYVEAGTPPTEWTRPRPRS